MDWKNIREELLRLSEVVDGWNGRKDSGVLERDWVLEKLRSLYETIRFSEFAEKPEPLSAKKDEPEPEPETFVMEDTPDLDLSGMLALEPEVEPIQPDVPVQIETLGEPVALQPESTPEKYGSFVPAPEPEPVPQSEPEELAQESFVPSNPVLRRPERSARPDVERLTAPETGQAVETTLFDSEPEEDDAARHRRKQRVIMSLYGGEAGAQMQPDQPASKPKNVESRIVPEPIEPPRPPKPVEQVHAVKPEATVPKAAPKAPVAPRRPVDSRPEIAKNRRDGSVTFEEITVETVVSDDPMSMPGGGYSKIEPSRSAPSGNVLGEVINQHVQTLADTIEPPRNVASALRRKGTVSDLRQAIGINDKFLLIRDLFGGDSDAYDEAMQTLNRFDNLDDCVIYLTESYAWNANSDSVRLLMDLLERKFA